MSGMAQMVWVSQLENLKNHRDCNNSDQSQLLFYMQLCLIENKT